MLDGGGEPVGVRVTRHDPDDERKAAPFGLFGASAAVCLVAGALVEQSSRVLGTAVDLDEPAVDEGGIVRIAGHDVQVRLQYEACSAEPGVASPAIRFELHPDELDVAGAVGQDKREVPIGDREAVTEEQLAGLMKPLADSRAGSQQPITQRADLPDERRRSGSHAANAPSQMCKYSEVCKAMEGAATDPSGGERSGMTIEGEALDLTGRQVAVCGDGSQDLPVPGAQGEPHRREATPPNARVRRTLRTRSSRRRCNHGWMNDLENEAEDELKRLIDCQPHDVTPESADVVSRWIAKTAVIIEQLSPRPPAYTPEQLRIMQDSGKPPMFFTYSFAKEPTELVYHRSSPTLLVDADRGPLDPNVDTTCGVVSIHFRRALFMCVHTASPEMAGALGSFGMSNVLGVQNQVSTDQPEPWPDSRPVLNQMQSETRHEVLVNAINMGFSGQRGLIVDGSGRRPPIRVGRDAVDYSPQPGGR